MTVTSKLANIEDIFLNARTKYNWQDRAVDTALLKEIYDLAKFPPTSTNTNPMRILFAISLQEKARILASVVGPNKAKVEGAPVCAIIAYDMEFYMNLPKLFPHTDGKARFVGKPDYIADTAYRNGTLQAGYFIIAARALGLDCGPISGFDADLINREYFPDGRYQVNFLCSLGYGMPEDPYPRLPRLDFEEACKII